MNKNLGLISKTRLLASGKAKEIGAPFPVDVFSDTKEIHDLITSANSVFNFPTDYTSAAALFAASTAIGNSYKLKVKETWHEHAGIYIAIVGAPGEYKTHSIDLAITPLNECKKKYSSHNIEALKTYDKQLKEFKVQPEKFDNIEPEKPTAKYILIGGHTLEALMKALSENNKGIGFVVDELMGFFNNMNKYNKGSDTEAYLSLWSAKDPSTLLKTEVYKPISLPFFNMLGGTQTDILCDLSKNNRDKNGFVDRILFAMPDSTPLTVWNDADIPQIVLQGYSNVINRLIELQLKSDWEGNTNPNYLELSKDAKSIWVEWYNQNAALKKNSTSNAEKGIFTKLESYTLRLSLILQLLRYACNVGDCKEVSAQAMQGAIKLSEYFRATALRVQNFISNVDPISNLTTEQQALYNMLPETFKTGEGIEVAISLLPVGTSKETATTQLKRLLKVKELFTKTAHGCYLKAA